MSFFQSNGTSVKFPNQGDTFTGVITSPVTESQSTDFNTKQPATWPDGNPKMQATVQMDAADGSGAYTLYVPASSRMQKAIGSAIAQVGAPDLAVGGTLSVQFVGMGQSKNGLNPPKEFAASYTAPQAPQGGQFQQQQQVQQPNYGQVSQPQAMQQDPRSNNTQPAPY